MKTSRLVSCLLGIILLVSCLIPQSFVVHADTSHRKPISAENISELAVKTRYGEGLIYNARWTERGNLFVECASSGVWLYDGNAVEQPSHLLEGSARCLEFDANADGTIIAWSSTDPNTDAEYDNIVYLIDTKAGKQQQFSMSTEGNCSCSGDIQGVALSLDGLLLASLGADGVIDVWEIASGKQLFFLTPADVMNNQAVVSLDGALEIRQFGFTLEVRDRKTKQIRTKILGFRQMFDTSSLEGQVWALGNDIFSPDGKLVAAGNTALFSARTADKWFNLPENSSSVAFSPDDKTLAIGQADGSIAFFDVARLRQKSLIKGNTGSSISLAYRPDGQMLASVGMDLAVRFWDVKSGHQIDLHDRGNLALGRVRFSPDGKLIGATGNRSLYIWDAASGQRLVSRHLKEVKLENEWVYWQTSTLYFSPYELSFTAENAKVYTSNASEQVSIWDSRTGNLVNSQKIVPGLEAYFAADGSIFTASEKRVRHFDLTGTSSDSALQTLDSQYKYPITQLAASGDSMSVAVSDGQQIELWDVKTATQKVAFSLADNQIVSNLALNADGTMLAIARGDAGVEIWDMRLQKRIALASIYGYPNPWWSSDADFPVPMAFSPDGQLLAAGSSINGQLFIFEVRTGRQLRVMNLHRNGVTDLQFNADGTRLASAGLDGVAFVLEIVDQVML